MVNAADAMNATNSGARKLTIRTDLVGGDVRVRVIDSGPGIAAEDMKDVFDAFWSTKPGGVGIGLAICKSIVVMHKGRLTATNNLEGGATFAALLPAQAQA
jgi:signal transduction histidine kinase